MTDGKGEFTILGVVPGQYTVRVLRSPPVQRPVRPSQVAVTVGNNSFGFATGSADVNPPVSAEPILWGMVPLAVSDADVTGLSVTLRTGVRVSGRVEFSGSGQPPDPGKMQAFRLSLTPIPGSSSAWLVAPADSHLEDNGQFTTSQFAPGGYILGASGTAGWVLKSAMVGGKDVADVALELGASDLTDVVITMSDRPSKVTGVVTAGQGETATLSTVAVFSTDQSYWPKAGSRSRRVVTATPGRDGKFAVSGLPAGDYFIAAVSGSAALDFNDARVLSSIAGQAARISVAEGGAVTQDLRVIVIK
jgi:hypothetical protein